MENFTTKIEGYNQEFNFECYDNTETINIGEPYIFFFGGIADVQICQNELEFSEINKNDRPYQKDKIDLVHSFWKKCYKIKSTDFDLTKLQ